MQHLLSQIKIRINSNTFIKDPDSSDLGRKIVSESIVLITEIGFEAFTFKKLGAKIGSPESTIYRYFENKHKLLLYLTLWYWSWLEYRLVFAIANIPSSEEKLTKALEILTEPVQEDGNFSHINEILLNKIVIVESAKSYFTKKVDDENKVGLFDVYKHLVQRVADIILDIAPDYQYPNMLVSTVIEGAHQQKYFSEHLPLLTNVNKGDSDISAFFTHMVFSTIQHNA